MNIFVARLDYSIDESGLREVFEEYGQVDSVKIIMDKFSGRSKGFGFVEMPDDNEAMQAINGLNDVELNNRAIVVKKATPKTDNHSNYRQRDRY
jgi:RNA recognition motif-containing protein